ncbi:MAG: hypothetical protein WBG42_11995 [Cryomorphaceae bacterium]
MNLSSEKPQSRSGGDFKEVLSVFLKSGAKVSIDRTDTLTKEIFLSSKECSPVKPSNTFSVFSKAQHLGETEEKSSASTAQQKSFCDKLTSLLPVE